MDAGFDDATAVRRRPDGSAYDVLLDAGWAIGDKPNGGYLTAVLARAAVAEVARDTDAHPHPLAVSAHFLRAPDPGEASVEVTVLRAGRSASQVQAVLRQGAHTCVVALLTLGALTAETPWWHDPSGQAPDVPPAEKCVLLPDEGPQGITVHLMRNVLERLDPATLGWAVGEPRGAAELRGHVSLADGADWSPLSLLVALDCLPPVTFDLGTSGWVPTLELTCYLRGLPAPGPLRIRQSGGLVQAGRVDETCTVWDSRGVVVGSATQLAGVRVPDRPPAGR